MPQKADRNNIDQASTRREAPDCDSVESVTIILCVHLASHCPFLPCRKKDGTRRLRKVKVSHMLTEHSVYFRV